MNRHDVVIWGASGHALVVADILRLLGYEVVGYLDDIHPERCGESFGGALVLGGREQLFCLFDRGIKQAVLGVGDNQARLALAPFVRARGLKLLRAVHPRATVAGSVTVGEGTVIAAGAVVNPACRIGENVIINTSTSIDHESFVADGAHLAPGVHAAARTNIGRGAFVGVGSAIRDRVRIGDYAVVGAGSVVVRDIPDRVVAYGVPARVVRRIVLTKRN